MSAQMDIARFASGLLLRDARTRARYGGMNIHHGAPMDRKLISSGSPFESEIAYSRAVVQGDWIFVSGTTGFDYGTMSISDRIEKQCAQCLKNIEAALAQAGASFHDIVRVRYILPNGEDFSRCWPILRQYFGEIRPAATMISARLLDPRMLIEIEVTALRAGRT